MNVRHRDELWDEMSLLVRALVTVTLWYKFEVHISRDESKRTTTTIDGGNFSVRIQGSCNIHRRCMSKQYDSLMLYSGELCSLSLAAVMFYFIWYGHVVPCMWGDAATVCCVSSSFLEIDIASDMRDEATRGQHKICWICELFRGTKVTCVCDGEGWSCAM